MSNLVGYSNDETNFPQFLRICKTFANVSSTDTKIPKTQLSKMIQLGECLSILLSSIKAITTGINKIQDLASNVSVDPFNDIVNVPKMLQKILPQGELMGSKITLTNNKIKKVEKIIRSS